LNQRLLKRLKDRGGVGRVHVAFDPIEWASGVDLDPEFVYKGAATHMRSNEGSIRG